MKKQMGEEETERHGRLGPQLSTAQNAHVRQTFLQAACERRAGRRALAEGMSFWLPLRSLASSFLLNTSLQ